MTTPSRQPIKDDHQMFSLDNTILEQVKKTHAPDDQYVDVRSILNIVEDVFRRAPLRQYDGMAAYELVDSMHDGIRGAVIEGHGMVEALAFIIQKVLCEITCKCGGGDAHGTTMSLLQMLSNYSWDAKVVITLAALALSYADFWLTGQLFPTHPLAKYMAVLKQLPDIREHSNALKSRFDALAGLIGAMVDVTKAVHEFSLMLPLPISMTNIIQTAAYWTIRSILACASEISSFIGMNVDYASSTTETSELSSLAQKERNIHDHLTQQLALFYQQIDEKKHTDAFDNLVRLFDRPQHDNIRILKHLIYPKDDIQPLFYGLTKKRVDIDTLKRKTVVLLISDLDVLYEELIVLDSIYSDSRSRPELEYEIVWLLIVDHSDTWNEEHQQKFEQLQSIMSWHTMHHPKLLDPAAMRYIKDVWLFQKRMILVVLDPDGKVVSPNALHMMFIWGNYAFPFTAMKESSLWKDETWRLEFLVDGIDPRIFDWVERGRHICMYGGDDMDWIRRFTTTTKQIARAVGVEIELIYVGKSNSKERIKKIIADIDTEQLSDTWIDPTLHWYFWTRLECMMYSKMKIGSDVKQDHIMQEVMTLLSYDGSEQGWANIWIGFDEMARAKGDIMLKSFSKFEDWEENARIRGFVPALREHLMQLDTPNHCTRVTWPRSEGRIPEKMVCADCDRDMDKYVMYRCCTD